MLQKIYITRICFEKSANIISFILHTFSQWKIQISGITLAEIECSLFHVSHVCTSSISASHCIYICICTYLFMRETLYYNESSISTLCNRFSGRLFVLQCKSGRPYVEISTDRHQISLIIFTTRRILSWNWIVVEKLPSFLPNIYLVDINVSVVLVYSKEIKQKLVF